MRCISSQLRTKEKQPCRHKVIKIGKVLLYAAFIVCVAGAVVDKFIHRFPTAGYIIFLGVCTLVGTLGLSDRNQEKGLTMISGALFAVN